MRCAICDSNAFVATVYHTRDRQCPALACTECGAVSLNVEVAGNDAERESVRLAIAKRAALASDEHSSRGGSPSRLGGSHAA